jgi:predicted nucleic acid-binding protein
MEEAYRLVIPSVVAGELFAGFDRGNRREMNYAEFDHFFNLPGVRIQDAGINEARHFANLVNNLKKHGNLSPPTMSGLPL